MSNKFIEVELRGPLSQDDYLRLRGMLIKKGKLINKQNRFLLDFSTFLEGIGERVLDVRIRITNGVVEMIVKKGKFGGLSREEASVFPKDGNLKNTLKFMSLLGYNKAVAADRGIERFEIEGIEFALQDVKDFSKPGTIHSRFFEAEILCSNENEKEHAIIKIQDFLSKISLKQFTEPEWNNYIAKLNKEANGVFDFTIDSVDEIINMGQ